MREPLMRWLRVPERPDLPSEDPSAVRLFKAAPAWLGYRRVRWALKQGSALIGLFVGLYWFRNVNFYPSRIDLGPITLGTGFFDFVRLAVEASAWAGFAAQAGASLLLLRLDWEQRWYLVSDRSLRVREGIVRLHEKTTTFENIQNVTYRQGPLQRLFGIADLEVRSAGGGGSKDGDGVGGDDLHTVWFRGVADAPGIRDTILRRVQRAREAKRTPQATPAEAALGRLSAAADALRAEARALAPGHADPALPPGS